MTEKRFTIRSYNGIGCHIFDGSIVIAEVHRADIKQLCDLLNALHEENEQLKHDATVLICSNQEYRKENEQLKKDNFKAFALLGDIRALLRTNSYDTVIEKINKFEKEVLK